MGCSSTQKYLQRATTLGLARLRPAAVTIPDCLINPTRGDVSVTSTRSPTWKPADRRRFAGKLRKPPPLLLPVLKFDSARISTRGSFSRWCRLQFALRGITKGRRRVLEYHEVLICCRLMPYTPQLPRLQAVGGPLSFADHKTHYLQRSVYGTATL